MPPVPDTQPRSTAPVNPVSEYLTDVLGVRFLFAWGAGVSCPDSISMSRYRKAQTVSDPVVQLIVKMVVSGVFVGLISELAKRLPGVGGLVAALPVVSLTTIFWLLVDHQTNTQIAQFIRGILYGLIPTTLFLALLMFLLDREVKFVFALGISLIALSVTWVVVRAVVA